MYTWIKRRGTTINLSATNRSSRSPPETRPSRPSTWRRHKHTATTTTTNDNNGNNNYHSNTSNHTDNDKHSI